MVSLFVNPLTASSQWVHKQGNHLLAVEWDILSGILNPYCVKWELKAVDISTILTSTSKMLRKVAIFHVCQFFP